jgi:hypothetical protein
MAALVDERSRQESELRPRRIRRRPISPSDSIAPDTEGNLRSTILSSRDDIIAIKSTSAFPAKSHQGTVDGHFLRRATVDSESQKMQESVARASMLSKFDHVGIEPHSSVDRDARAMAIHRGMTNSPPPPSLTLPGGLPSHPVSGFVRHHVQEKSDNHFLVVSSPSPHLLASSEVTGTHSAAYLQSSRTVPLLPIHPAVALSSAFLGQRIAAPLDVDGNAEVPEIEVSIQKKIRAAGVHSD